VIKHPVFFRFHLLVPANISVKSVLRLTCHCIKILILSILIWYNPQLMLKKNLYCYSNNHDGESFFGAEIDNLVKIVKNQFLNAEKNNK
jgi:hypothetical protein